MGQAVRLRDTRRTDWFWVQHVLIDVFQPVIGPLGVTVYNALCREVERNVQVVEFSMRELGEMASVSKDTAQRMLWKMQVLGMVKVRTTRQRRSECELLDLDDAAGLDNKRATPEDRVRCVQRLRERLAEAEAAGKPKAPAKSRHELALEDPGLFDELIEAPASAAAVSHRDSRELESVSQAETRCLKNGGVLSQNQGVLSHNSETRIQCLREEERRKETTLPNPPAGRASGEQALPAPVERTDGETVRQPTDTVIAGLALLRPGIGDLSDLREQATLHMRAAGFAVQADAQISNRGDGRLGTVDLICTRANDVTVAIECDGTVPRERSLMKLARLEAAGLRTVLLLRTGITRVVPGVRGPLPGRAGLTIIGMAWPGNSQYAPAPRGAAEQQARAAVGVAQPVSHGDSSHIDASSVRRLFSRMRDEVLQIVDVVPGDPVVNPMAEWDAAFGSLSYERHEAIEGGTLLVVSAAQPAETVGMLLVYGERIARGLAQAFGCAVHLQVVGADSS